MAARTTTAMAPARVNIIGEHTDYNDGYVLPTATALYTRVVAVARADTVLEVCSSTVDDVATLSLPDLESEPQAGWVAYVQGVAAELIAAGVRLPGATLTIDSDIPLGAGLSSSASLELAVARALAVLGDADLAAAELALLAQRAEHDYAGVQCGIMDQFAVACAEYGNALLLDCRDLAIEQVPLPADLAFILTDSGVRHQHADSGYNRRAEECQAATQILASQLPAPASLRDIDLVLLEARRDDLGDTLYRRCRHVVTENQRVLDAVMALKHGNLPLLGDLLNRSHQSLRDDYEVSCEPVDQLVTWANDGPGVLGSRQVGGGFGGCVLSACHEANAEAAALHIREQFTAAHGAAPWQHLVTPAWPAHTEAPQ